MSTTHTKPNGLRRLDLKTWRPKVEDLIMAQQTKKEADAASRAADATIKALVAELSIAMDGAPAALCGGAVLTVKESAGAAGALTLRDGSKCKLKYVTAYLVGNTQISAENVIAVYGGRSGSVSLSVTGTP